MKHKTSLTAQLPGYLFTNILAMVGVSFYILADTFFVSQAAGALGIGALNLSLPVYGLIFACGAMIGTGFATRYSLEGGGQEAKARTCFFQALVWVLLFSVPFVLLGLFRPALVLQLMGADADILSTGLAYVKIVLLCAPFFMLNTVFNAFVRNDHDPALAMAATLTNSFLNILLDYVFMFVFGMGMAGAALATGLCPLAGSLVCLGHFFKKSCQLRLVPSRLSLHLLASSCALGVSGFIGEISGAITSYVFNILLLYFSGNLALAAYGVTANIALVAIAVFNGIANGMQPLASQATARRERKALKALFLSSMLCALVLAVAVIGLCWVGSAQIVAIFNSENDPQLASIARIGLHLYSLGFFFAALNIVTCGYFSATGQALACFVVSILRGVVAIVLFAIAFAWLWGLHGIWLSFLASEAFTFLVSLVFLLLQKRRV